MYEKGCKNIIRVSSGKTRDSGQWNEEKNICLFFRVDLLLTFNHIFRMRHHAREMQQKTRVQLLKKNV